MALLDDAASALKRGYAGLRGQTPTVPPSAGGAMPPPTPLPNIDPSMANAAPAAVADAGAGMRGTSTQFQGPPNPNANPNVGSGAASAEAQAYQAARTAAPTVAPAAEVAGGQGLAGAAYRAGQAAGPVAQAAGRVARFGGTPLAADAAPSLLTKALPIVAGLSAKDSFETPTAQYNSRLGLSANPGFEDSTTGRLGQLAQDVGVRTAGVASDLGANVLDLGTSAVNGLRGAFGAAPIQTFKSIVSANDGGPAPIVPATSSAPATDKPAMPGETATGLPAAPLSLSSTTPSNLESGKATSVPGITRNGNSITNVGTNPDGSNGATTQLPNTGFDLGQANAIQARANAITASTQQSDPNALFSTTGGRATSVGTPLSAEPRMQVSDGGGGLGGLIVAKQAARQQALDLQRQSVVGDQALRGQDLGLRRQQLGFDNQFRAATLGHTIDHDNATVGLAGQQLKREGLRDNALAQHQQNEENIAKSRIAAEFGPTSLRERAFANTQDQEALKNRSDAENSYGKQVAGSISNTLRDDKGNVDPNIIAEHVQNANGLVANRISQLQAELKANPNNATAAKVLDQYQRNGVGALSAGDREQVQSATEFGQLARKYGTGDLNPFGGTNVESRTPVDQIRKETGITGSVYRGYQNGKPTAMTVPARKIDLVDGGLLGNGTRQSRFQSLMPKAQ